MSKSRSVTTTICWPEVFFMRQKMITEQMHTGDTFSHWHKVVTINIVDFLYWPTPTDHVTLQLGDRHTDLVVPDYLALHFLELPKWAGARIIKERRLAQWMAFLTATSPTQREDMAVNDAVIQKALKTLDYLSQDPAARELYDQRLRELAGYLTDMRGEYARGTNEGIEKGIQLGREEGLREGQVRTQLAIARELLTLGQTLESVAQIVKLPVEEIRQLLSQD